MGSIGTIAAVIAAGLLIGGCAVEVPKSALSGFRLTPPIESSARKPTEQRS